MPTAPPGLAVYLQQSSSELEWSGLSDTPTMTNFSSGATAIKDFSGKENSHNWTLYYGHTNTWNGIGYCHNLTTGGTQKRQWFVPALGEMNEIAVKNLEAVNDSLLALDTVGAAQIGTSYQYSSTEQNANNIYVSYQASATDKYTTRIKVQKNYYRCACRLISVTALPSRKLVPQIMSIPVRRILQSTLPAVRGRPAAVTIGLVPAQTDTFGTMTATYRPGERQPGMKPTLACPARLTTNIPAAAAILPGRSERLVPASMRSAAAPAVMSGLTALARLAVRSAR